MTVQTSLQPTYRVLIATADPRQREELAGYLGSAEFKVCTADSPAALDQMLTSAPFSLVLLDLHLPGGCSRSICQRLSEQGTTGVIVLSRSEDPIDRILCLELGADDYVMTPVEMRELVARMRAVLRRTTLAAAGRNGGAAAYRFHGFRLEVARRLLHRPDGRATPLRPQEVAILTALVQRQGQVLTREELIELACRAEPVNGGRAIDTQVSRLRRKLQVAGRPMLIRTVYGLGYVLDGETQVGLPAAADMLAGRVGGLQASFAG